MGLVEEGTNEEEVHQKIAEINYFASDSKQTITFRVFQQEMVSLLN